MYEIHYLTETDQISFVQSGDCETEAEALNRAWYFLGFGNDPGLRLYVYPEAELTMGEVRGGEPLATLRPLAKGTTAEREKGRNGSLADWMALFREEGDSPLPPPGGAPGDSYAGSEITDDDIPF